MSVSLQSPLRSSGRAGRSCLPSAVSQGRWGLKPVAAELQGAERIQQAEGIIQVGSVLAETVAVVPFFQSPAGFVVGDVGSADISGW